MKIKEDHVRLILYEFTRYLEIGEVFLATNKKEGYTRLPQHQIADLKDEFIEIYKDKAFRIIGSEK